MPSYPYEHVLDFAVRLLLAKGVPDANARAIADIVVRTEAFGARTHGVAFLTYADSMIPGELDPKAEPVVVNERAGAALLDGNRGFSQVAMRLAMSLAMQKARVNGIAMVAVRNAFWLGALGPYLIEPARRGLLAQMTAQTSTCRDCAPFGGIDARFSTNPVALALPTGDDPIIADFSTAMMSMGKVNAMIRRGDKAAEPSFMDKDGTTGVDPTVVRDGGSILFLGGARQGYHGYALSLWNEAMTALAGGDCNNPAAKTRQCFTLTVVDPALFAGTDAYLREFRRFLVHLRTSRVHPGHDGVRLPGERGFRSLEQSRTAGMALEQFMVDKLNEAADRNRIARLG